MTSQPVPVCNTARPTPRRARRSALVQMVALATLLAGAQAAPAHPRPSPGGLPRDGVVQSWVTDLSTDQRLSPQPDVYFETGRLEKGRTDPADTVLVDPRRRYQRMTGFGASMTDTSATVLSGLDAQTRRATMKSLFSTDDGGIGLSMLRQPMGASDFSAHGSYSYNDQPAGQTDPDLSDFSIDHDREAILPRLREALRLNPDLTTMASPWSAPGWMKDTDSMITGSLKPEHQRAYAQYFVKFLKAYRAAGVPTDYVSMQNEPLYEPADYPGMGVTATQQTEFIGKHLGPAIERSGQKTKILGYDHNWDVTAYPEEIYANPQAAKYVPGTAWHCYGGEVTAQTASHNSYPHAQAFLTECSGGTWQGTTADAFEQSMASVIGVPRNWGQSVVLWNLALDEKNGPTNGGCQTCRGVVTVKDDGTVDKEVEYWALGHASRFVKPGAVRIGSSQIVSSQPDGAVSDVAVSNVAFANRDGSQVMIARNTTDTGQTFAVRVGDRHFDATLAPGAAVTYRWAGPKHVAPTHGDLGWVDLDLGRGPAGTPGGRLVQSVSPAVVDQLNQVRLGETWLAYSQPSGSRLSGRGSASDLDRSDWTVSTSASDPGSPVAAMIDGDPTTRWSSGTGQAAGTAVTLDLGATQTFDQIVLDAEASPGDYVRRYRLETSTDGTTWTAVARGQGSGGTMTIPLPPTATRHLRIVSEASSGSWWSIHELTLQTSEASSTDGPRGDLRRDAGRLADGTSVRAVYNAGRRDATLAVPVKGFGWTYSLPPTAAVTFAVWPTE